jgi:TrpR family trp operon transcriptional repressor
MQNIQKISKLVKNLHSEAEIESFFKELLTESEIETLSKRWRILDLLAQGSTQRDIAKELQVSLCKVTRGAKILKNKDSILANYLIKGGYNGNN